MSAPRRPSPKQLRDWKRDLCRLLGEMEIANGDHAPGTSCDKLECLVRFAFEEAYERVRQDDEALRCGHMTESGYAIPF